ncbi:CHAT domain-containing protein [Bradyrhizobium embrapense]|uniref:CHAT domain-containing protein n=1 Tax=Bradyrhizobium embrapense TaxID=630921 RepID=UPI0012F50BC6|nr:CHAT domain-containing protein [Bradyrhizobium embrapense]
MDDVLVEAHVTKPQRLARISQEWTYILRVRARWAQDTDLRGRLAERAVKDLRSIGISEHQLQRLATADRIEVELVTLDPSGFDDGDAYEAASEMPWEYLISAATRAEGRFRPLLITRLLRNGLGRVTPHPPKSVLFVESAPGRLNDQYSFDEEEERISAAVGVSVKNKKRSRPLEWETLKTPSFSKLKAELHSNNWEAVHVTGVDNHQAGWFIDNFYEDLESDSPDRLKAVMDVHGRLRDGMILWEGTDSELPVSFYQLAQTLVGRHPPRIVTLNLYYSGARIGRELVKSGAHVALGFLDEIDDEIAENFFQEFYWSWCHPDNAILAISDAFLKAWQKVSAKNLHGTSIVIWMGRSVFDDREYKKRPPARATSRRRTAR